MCARSLHSRKKRAKLGRGAAQGHTGTSSHPCVNFEKEVNITKGKCTTWDKSQ